MAAANRWMFTLSPKTWQRAGAIGIL